MHRAFEQDGNDAVRVQRRERGHQLLGEIGLARAMLGVGGGKPGGDVARPRLIAELRRQRRQKRTLVQGEDQWRQDVMGDGEIHQCLPGEAGLERAQAEHGRGLRVRRVRKHAAQQREQVLVGDGGRQAIQRRPQSRMPQSRVRRPSCRNPYARDCKIGGGQRRSYLKSEVSCDPKRRFRKRQARPKRTVPLV